MAIVKTVAGIGFVTIIVGLMLVMLTTHSETYYPDDEACTRGDQAERTVTSGLEIAAYGGALLLGALAIAGIGFVKDAVVDKIRRDGP